MDKNPKLVKGLSMGSVHQRGLSVAEFMISMALGLVLLAAVATFFVAQTQNQKSLMNSMDQVENGRYAVEVVGRYVALAGFYGAHFSLADDKSLATFTPPSSCTDLSANSLLFAVQGGAAPNTLSSNAMCIPAANYYANTDAILVRSVSNQTTSVAALDSNLTYMQTATFPLTGVLNNTQPSQCNGSACTANVPTDYYISTYNRIAEGSSPSSFSLKNANSTIVKGDPGSLGDIRAYQPRLFYIAKCFSGSCTNANDMPTLRVMEYQNATTGFVDTPLVEGIERMNIEYGVDDMIGTGQSAAPSFDGLPPNAVGDGFADTYTRTPSNAQWPKIVSVRITIVARSTEPSVGYTDNRTYVLSPGVTYTPTGVAARYKRKLYSQVISLDNIAFRRQQ